MSSVARLHEGDCLPFLKQCQDDTVDAIVTDCPFGVSYKNDIYDDTKEVIESHIPEWYAEWYRILKPNCYVFAYVGVKNINVWIDEAIKAGFDYRNILATRSFTRGGLSAKGNFCFEFQPILVLSKGKGKYFNKVNFFPQSEEWKNDKRNKNPSEWTYSYSNWIPSEITFSTEVFGSIKGAEKTFHPNAKNVKLEQFLIEIATNKGEVVLDPFMGSGTTGVAALQTERNFLGCEMNEKWFVNAKERIEQCNPLFSRVEVV